MRNTIRATIALLATLLLAIGLAAGAASAADWNYEADVVVVGGGGGGLSAALTAAEGGASVVVLEKSGVLGGSTNFAEGMFGAETQMQKLAFIGLTKDEVFRGKMQENYWAINADLTRAYINESDKTIDWLVKEGVPFLGPQGNNYYNLRTWHLFQGGGASVVKALSSHLRGHDNVKILLQTQGKDLITDNGRITGVVAVDKAGQTIRVRALHGVVVSTGGFANNPDMIKKYAGDVRGGATVPLNKTGDGIQMGMTAGAATEGMDVLQLMASVSHPAGKSVPMQVWVAATQPTNIWVNKLGKRFVDETTAFDFAVGANAIDRQPGRFAWCIFDENLKQFYQNVGPEASVAQTFVPANKPIKDLDKQWQATVDGGNPYLVKADSVAELAAKMGVPADSLVQTLASYNHFAATNYDADYTKDKRYLRQLDTNGPLYAVRVNLTYLTTLGGLKVNANLQVLDSDNDVIPGLYAAGLDVGGLYAHTYSEAYASGSSCGFALNSGRMAAKTILQTLNQQ